MHLPLLTTLTLTVSIIALPSVAADFFDPAANREALPQVPPGFAVSFFAREPMIRQPCSMAFDARGRLCVGMGPQYRNPKPDTPGDSVVLVLDDNRDGRADRTKVFATGFNAIQGLAWRGSDLWVANAPDLTLVRDLDGDDAADEYVRIFTDLGNLEHGLHGLNWAPDGKLYMSKGNSKGLTQAGGLAPKPFRDLWGVTAPAGAPDFPEPQTFRPSEYRHAYHDPDDDWGREGGVLRCDDGGRNLEIVARGFRNPWDITFDSGFNWIGTDNDQTMGDRVFMPFFGAHYGWNHPWSAQWADASESPAAPVSGPLFEGSGTGTIFGDSPQFPASYRGAFFINDWLRKATYVWRPRWDGALLRPAGGDWEPFVQGRTALFRPTDLEFGPDGALWILGWSSGYGAEYKNGEMSNEGRVFRVTWKEAPPNGEPAPKRSRQIRDWTVAELIEDFESPVAVRRTDAQEELVRRGDTVKPALLATLQREVAAPASGRKTADAATARETWTAWTLGRLAPGDASLDSWFAARVGDGAASLNLQIQALRILAHRRRAAGGNRPLPLPVQAALRHPEPRLRFEAVQAIGQAQDQQAVGGVLNLTALETDRTVFYAAWQMLRRLQATSALKSSLADARGGVRRAALLALLEDHALQPGDVTPLMERDNDPGVRDIAARWLSKAAGGGEAVVLRGRPLVGAKAGAHRPARPANWDGAQSAQPLRVERPFPSPWGSLIRNLNARSGNRYVSVPSGLQPGERAYTDRGYPLKQVPPALLGMELIQTANEDDGSQGDEFLTFDAAFPVRIHVGLDARLARPPAWVRAGFRRSQHSILADHWEFQMYTREFPAGRIVLGGNTDDGRIGGKGNYIVAIEPLPLTPPAMPTTVERALALLSTAERERGAWLFHHRNGAGCFNCHQLAANGNPFGPDLAGVASRADARHIVQSMLEPDAVITEGFKLQTVETADAEYSGILLEESGLSVALGLATGEKQTILKTAIVARKSAVSSAMPAYSAALAAQSVADLAAYLLAQKSDPPADPRANRTMAATAGPIPSTSAIDKPAASASADARRGSGGPLAFRRENDRLTITQGTQPVAEFVFRDEKILRPHFANVHSPGGFKVTRHHPPIAGVDDTDHETMHPGLWLAFGDISGVDFWRNGGRIEHGTFVEEPVLREGRLHFSTESALRARDGRTLGAVTNRLIVAPAAKSWLFVWEATFASGDGDLIFGDQEEMGFGGRVATAITEKNGGAILTSAGRKGARESWGHPAEWCEYSGLAEGRRLALTLMTDPANFRPSWWHNRDYGVFVANPFGRSAMRQGERSSVVVGRGQTLRLCFGAAASDGPVDAPANSQAAYREFLEIRKLQQSK